MKHKFFAYCPESGFEIHETLEGALDDASDAIQNYLEDGWSEEVAGVCVGEITHRAKMCDQVFPDGEIDEDGSDEAGEHWDPDWEYKCNCKILPVESEKTAFDAPEQEPVAWIINHPDWSSSEPVLKKNIAERYELDQPGCTTPLYLHPQPAPEVALVEAFDAGQRAAQAEAAVLVDALNVVKAILESDDPAIADTVWVPGAPETLLDHVWAALDAYRKQGSES